MAGYKKLGESLVYKSKLVELYEDHLLLPNGEEVVYDLMNKTTNNNNVFSVVRSMLCYYIVFVGKYT